MDNLIFDQKAYSEYMDDLNYSQGFYVTPGRDGSVLVGRIRRVGEYSGDLYRKAEQAARFAVEEHNKEEGEKGLLKFLRIVNLNVEPAAAAVYYITMAAADSAGETCHYQAKVWEKINTGYKLQIFRLAPYWLKFSVAKFHTDVVEVFLLRSKSGFYHDGLLHQISLQTTSAVLGLIS